MSLKPQPDSFVPADTLRVAKAAFAKGNPYLTLPDELGPIFADADFTELFSEVGQSAMPPWRLALVGIRQRFVHFGVIRGYRSEAQRS